jgi:hypothetical protein
VKTTLRFASKLGVALVIVLVALTIISYAQTNTTSQPLFPKYLVVGIVYAPPGSSSSVTYSSSNLVGSSNTVSTTNSQTVVNTSSFSAGAELGLFGASISYDQSEGWTTSSQNTNSVYLQTTKGNGITTMGPISSSLGVNHDNDIIYIWLNPAVSGTSSGTLNWAGLSSNSCDLTDLNDPLTFYQQMSGCDPNQYPFPDIIGIPVWCLKNPYWPGQGCAQWIPYTSRSWDQSYWGPQPTNQNGAALPSIAPGLALQDYADILQADPFVAMDGVYFNVCHSTYGPNMDPNDPEPVSLSPSTPTLARVPNSCAPNLYQGSTLRFQPYGTVEYPEPGPNGLPQTYTGQFQYSVTNTQGVTSIDTHTSTSSWFTTASFGDSFLGFGFDAAASSGQSNTTTWQQQNSTASTQGNTSYASYSITGPQLSDNYQGPATFNVYLDNVYGTFAFYSPLEPKVNLGFIAIATSPAEGVCPAQGSPEPAITFPQEPVTNPVTTSPVQTIYLTNCSPYPLTMVGPAVSFSDPGFSIANDGKDYCSNQVIPASPSPQYSGFYCQLDVVFAPVVSDAPNTIYGSTYPISATMIAAGTENASSYQNILVTNPAAVSAVAAVVTATPTVGATLLPTGTPQDPKEPNVYTFAAAGVSPQTVNFTFTNYYNQPVYFGPLSGIVTLNNSDYGDFAVLNNTCANNLIVQPAGTCTFTAQYPSTSGSATGLQQNGIVSTKLTVLASLNSLVSPTVAMASAGVAGSAPLTLTPGPVTFNVTGTYTGSSYSVTGNQVTATLKNNTGYAITNLTGSNSAFTAYVNTNGGNCPSTLANGSSCTVVFVDVSYTLVHVGAAYGTIIVSGKLSTGAAISATIDAISNNDVIAAADPNIVISGSEQSNTEQIPATYAKGSIAVDALVKPAGSSGSLAITVGSFSTSASYPAGASAATAAAAIAAALNVQGSPVTAEAKGSAVKLVSSVAGSAGNLTLTVTGDVNFKLVPSGPTLSGGKDAYTKTIYDGGTITVSTSGVIASATWGGKSTPESIAKALAISINKVAGAYLKASASGNVVSVTSIVQPPVSIGVNVTDSGGFTPPSFAAAITD